nr:hypothetical protein [Actinomycetota bacterium]
GDCGVEVGFELHALGEVGGVDPDHVGIELGQRHHEVVGAEIAPIGEDQHVAGHERPQLPHWRLRDRRRLRPGATQGNNLLAPLVEFLARAKDVGLHVIVARRSGGSGRALYEPLIARLRELSSPGIVMSGNRDEGPILGTVKPSAMPPGRGILVGRKAGQQLMQVAWLPPR